MPSIRDRLLVLIAASGLSNTELEKQTGLDRYKWGNIKARKQRVNEEHIEAAKILWPQYTYWLVTGETIPEAGQVSPHLERVRQDSNGAGKAG